jgi:hypothetical protein
VRHRRRVPNLLLFLRWPFSPLLPSSRRLLPALYLSLSSPHRSAGSLYPSSRLSSDGLLNLILAHLPPRIKTVLYPNTPSASSTPYCRRHSLETLSLHLATSTRKHTASMSSSPFLLLTRWQLPSRIDSCCSPGLLPSTQELAEP